MAVVMPVAERWGEPVAAGGATSSVEPGATASGDTHPPEAKSGIRSRMRVSADLAQAPGKLYLGGSFDGAPFSIVSSRSRRR